MENTSNIAPVDGQLVPACDRMLILTGFCFL